MRGMILIQDSISPYFFLVRQSFAQSHHLGHPRGDKAGREARCERVPPDGLESTEKRAYGLPGLLCDLELKERQQDKPRWR